MKTFRAVAALHVDVAARDANDATRIAKGVADHILAEGDLFNHVDLATIRAGSPAGDGRTEFDATLVARYEVDAADEASAVAAAAETLSKEVTTRSGWLSDGAVAYVEEKRP